MAKSRLMPAMFVLATALSGCMTTTGQGDGTVARFLTDGGSAPQRAQDAAAPDAPLSEVTPVISALKTRPSAIVPDTPYDRVAASVIAADARVAEAELHVARLRAEAARWNWLPRLGPRISLDSLGEWVAELVLNQVLFDNGRKVAERDLARAEVELAAVALVEDGNARVHDALTLYLTAEEGRARIAHYSEALEQLRKFEWVMERRVAGGVSDKSDLNVTRQKIATVVSRLGEAQANADTALAELRAMSAHPLDDLRGLGELRDSSHGAALGVLRAQAERDRALAEARIARASHLPGLAATASASRHGSRAGLEVTTDSLFGVGTISEMQAIEARKDAADRRVAQARETADRAIAAQSRKLESYRAQAAQARQLTAQARENFDLFRAQFEGGQRQVMDVVGVYETYASALESEIDLRFQAARADLELARLRGALAEGAKL